MAQPKSVESFDPAPMSPPAGYADLGGPVGRMHADLTRHLAARPRAETPVEHMIRRLSVAGGYLALAVGYGAAMLLVLR